MNKQIIITADFSRKNAEPERKQIELSVSEDTARHLCRVSLSSLDKKLLIVGTLLNSWSKLNGYTGVFQLVAISDSEANE
ncbi:MAG: hypothetical protein IJ598_04845 [Ruminococcus sp.]|nr:hypothetical protein [Ruminococcus sp.]